MQIFVINSARQTQGESSHFLRNRVSLSVGSCFLPSFHDHAPHHEMLESSPPHPSTHRPKCAQGNTTHHPTHVPPTCPTPFPVLIPKTHPPHSTHPTITFSTNIRNLKSAHPPFPTFNPVSNFHLSKNAGQNYTLACMSSERSGSHQRGWAQYPPKFCAKFRGQGPGP